MAVTEREFEQAARRTAALREAGHAVSARYDEQTLRVLVELSTGVEVAFPVHSVEGLADADPEELTNIEISPTDLGLHWPKLDADVYLPALLRGVLGSRQWMAAQLGASGGKVKSGSKAAASRENGRKGGRPRKAASG